MGTIPLAKAEWRRASASEPDVLLRNRFLEPNPVLSGAAPSYIQRPALRYWMSVGTQGPIRMVFSQPGAFNDDLFVVAFNSLYRINRVTQVATLLDNTLLGGDTNDAVRVCCTGDVGSIGPHLWIADGRTLRVYLEDGFANGVLTLTTAGTDGDVVRLGTVYYRLSTGSLDSGSPAGTAANPWRVLIGASILATYTNLFHAINDTGVNGTDYSTALTANPAAVATRATTTGGLQVRATALSIAGNATVSTTTGADLSWGAATLTGGGTAGVFPVELPDGVGCLDVGMINSYVIVVPAQGQGINGRYYWINPAEVSIDALDFATAERSADPAYQVIVFGDQFLIVGQNTTEAYYMTGNPDSPVARVSGILFDRGCNPGCAIQVEDCMIMMDINGAVFENVGGGEKPISNPAIQEIFRRAITKQNFILG